MSPPTLSTTRPLFFYTGHIIFCVILLVWPWVFLGYLWAHRGVGGVRAPSSISTDVQKHPQDVDFFVTSVSYGIGFIVSYSYSRAISTFYSIRYSPKSETGTKGDLEREFFQYWKIPTIEWSLEVVWGTIIKGRQGIHLLAVLMFYMIVFIFIASGLNALLIPHAFIRTMPVEGQEIDLSSTDPSCVEWLNTTQRNQQSQECNWIVSIVSILLTVDC
jgi:hypothetical protein